MEFVETNHINIAVQGCCHGELDTIYKAINESNIKVDLLLICGDFECMRQEADLQCLAVPMKYRKMVNNNFKIVFIYFINLNIYIF